MSMCVHDSEILLLKFDNRCTCKGCPAQIRRAIVNFEGVRETRSVDYDRGVAELIVNAEVAKNPHKLCDWIRKECKKHAYVDKECHTSSFMHEHGERDIKEKISYREHTDREFRITKYY